MEACSDALQVQKGQDNLLVKYPADPKRDHQMAC